MSKISRRTLLYLYGALFFFAFHSYFLLYMQSSFINQFLPNESSLIYVYGLSAILTMILFLGAPRIVAKYIDSKIAILLVTVEMFVCIALGYAHEPIILLIAFIVQQAISPLIFYVFDILIEHNSKQAETGHIRGRAFTAANIALVISPIIAGVVSTTAGLQAIYPISILFLMPLIIILHRIEKTDSVVSTDHTSILHVLKTFLSTKSRPVRLIFLVNLTLHIFYAWMVIYAPIYLQHQGFNWDQIGIMFSIMLLPFLLFQLPLGILADGSFGHKKALLIGTITMGSAVLVFAYTTSTNIFIWAFILFMTRVGASCIEIMSETYFFKHISSRDVYTLALFRFNKPLSQIIGPLLATISIWYMNESLSYVILAVIIFLSISYILPLPDQATVPEHIG